MAAADDRLERLLPAGPAAFRSGDLISDIDSLTDRWLRVRLLYAVALAAAAELRDALCLTGGRLAPVPDAGQRWALVAR